MTNETDLQQAGVQAMPEQPADEQSLVLDEFNQALGDEPVATPEAGATAEPTAGTPTAVAYEGAAGLEAIYDIPVNITVVLGRTNIEVSDLLALGKGDIVELDRKVGESIDILVNNRLVARGEVVLVEEQLGITMTEIIKNNQSA